MSQNYLIIVLGPPAAGKTSLARRIAGGLGLPLLLRDDFKEALFDALGWSDRVWSRQLGLASAKVLYRAVEALLQADQSLVVESNFRDDYARDDVLALKAEYGCETIQLLCQADEQILLARFKGRVEGGQRHAGHVDHLNYAEMSELLQQHDWGALQVGGHVLLIDTNDFQRVDYERIIADVRQIIVCQEQAFS